MLAKNYIYRNLHKGNFSVKFKGIVKDRIDTAIAENVTFKVSEAGRQQVIKSGCKNVHAYVVCDTYKHTAKTKGLLDKITYNPKVSATFICNGKPIVAAEKVIFQDGKLYLLR